MKFAFVSPCSVEATNKWTNKKSDYRSVHNLYICLRRYMRIECMLCIGMLTYVYVAGDSALFLDIHLSTAHQRFYSNNTYKSHVLDSTGLNSFPEGAYFFEERLITLLCSRVVWNFGVVLFGRGVFQICTRAHLYRGKRFAVPRTSTHAMKNEFRLSSFPRSLEL